MVDGTTSIARRAGAAALILAAVQWMVGEAVAASAWTSPRYSYSHNFISDLGVPSCGAELRGRTICSPLYAVMNTTFIAQGVLFAVAAVLLFRLLPGRPGWVYLVLAVVHGVGLTLVALVHGSPEALADGSMQWHGIGAAMAILGGNLASIVVGCHLLRRVRWLGITEVALGAFGLACVLVLKTMTNTDIAAVFERGSVYAIMAAELVAGVALLGLGRSGRSLAAERTTAGAAG
jgi:hypothetical membrane protein